MREVTLSRAKPVSQDTRWQVSVTSRAVVSISLPSDAPDLIRPLEREKSVSDLPTAKKRARGWGHRDLSDGGFPHPVHVN